jgi:predicted DNA-binding transcriptional regulator
MENRDLALILVFAVGIFGFLISIYLIGMHTASSSFMGGMEEMMRRMMGAHSWNLHVPIYIWILTFSFLIITLVGVFGILYNVITRKSPEPSDKQIFEQRSVKPQPMDLLNDILKVLKNDERRVLELLIKNNGKMYQKDIRWETGYTRLKTHRIITRLIERGIVKKRAVGNTNEIILEDWILKRIKGNELSE